MSVPVLVYINDDEKTVVEQMFKPLAEKGILVAIARDFWRDFSR